MMKRRSDITMKFMTIIFSQQNLTTIKLEFKSDLCDEIILVTNMHVPAFKLPHVILACFKTIKDKLLGIFQFSNLA